MAEKVEEKKIKCVVIRSSCWVQGVDGNMRHVQPDDGENSVVQLTQSQYEVFRGIVCKFEDLAAESVHVSRERMQKPTPSAEAAMSAQAANAISPAAAAKAKQG
jgi:hypothetical protein